MSLWRLIVREIIYNKPGFSLGLLAVIIAVGIFTAEHTLLTVHDVETAKILAEKEGKLKAELARMEDDYRKIMKEMGFNLLIMPEGQNLGNFYTEGYASKFMPEEYVNRLADSKLMSIQHLLPSIEQKIRWPEVSNRTIILIGTRGEVPYFRRDPKEPILIAVPEGKIILGYELWKSLGLKTGDSLTLRGERFAVGECHPQRGTKDDITVWIDLKKAQEMLGREGEINAILALKCHCFGAELFNVRQDVMGILPGVQVIEFENKVTVRAQARDRARAIADSTLAAEADYRIILRTEKENFASLIIPLAILCSAALIGFLSFSNVRERRSEIGILRAIGLRSKQIVYVFLSKALVMGLAGAVVGYIIGFAIGVFSGEIDLVGGAVSGLFNPVSAAVALLVAPFLAALASWVPALIAARQDPAVVLKEE